MSSLPSDALAHLFSKLSAKCCARACAVCKHWYAVGSSAPVSAVHLKQEFNLRALSWGSSPYELFRFCVASPLVPVLNDLLSFHDWIKDIDSHGGWYLQLSRHPGSAPDSQHPATGACADSCQQPRIHPTSITKNAQSIWMQFRLPDWIGQASPSGPWSVNLQLIASIVTDGSQVQPLSVISYDNFRMPANDTEMLLQSHTDGLYAWEDEDHVLQLVAYVHMEHLLPLAYSKAQSHMVVCGRWGAVPRAAATVVLTGQCIDTLAGNDTESSDWQQQQRAHSLCSGVQIPVHPQLCCQGWTHRTSSGRLGVFLHLDFSQLSKADSRCSWVLLLISKHALTAGQWHAQQQGEEHVVFEASAADGLWAKLPSDAELPPHMTQADVRLQACLVLARRAGCVQAGRHAGEGAGGAAGPQPSHITTTPLRDHHQQQQQQQQHGSVVSGMAGSAPRSSAAYVPDAAVPQLIHTLDREGMLDFSLYPLGWSDQAAQQGDAGSEACEQPGPEGCEQPGPEGCEQPGPEGCDAGRLDTARPAHQESGGSLTGRGGDTHTAPPELDAAGGRLLIGRCGVEVWRQQDAELPPDAHVHWAAALQGQPGAGQQVWQQAGQHPPAPPASAFVRYVANFLVDGVKQQLWENNLQFWFHADAVNAIEAGATQQAGCGSGWGMARLVLTPASIRQLWGWGGMR